MTFDVSQSTLLLAQEGPPAPGGVAPATTVVPGGQGTGGTGGGSAAPGGSMMMILFMVVIAMVVFSMMGTRREKKKRDTMLNAIKKHDRVQTIGGVLGSVMEVKPDTVILKVDESSNTRITFARSSIQAVVNASDKSATTPDPEV